MYFCSEHNFTIMSLKVSLNFPLCFLFPLVAAHQIKRRKKKIRLKGRMQDVKMQRRKGTWYGPCTQAEGEAAVVCKWQWFDSVRISLSLHLPPIPVLFQCLRSQPAMTLALGCPYVTID